MNLSDINIAYVIQAFNRPEMFAPSLLSLRDQLISRNRSILLINDGAKTDNDVEKQTANLAIFETFLEGYSNKEVIVMSENNGAEQMFIKTFFMMFEDRKVDCFCLLEDDLYYERSYIHNVETLLFQTYEDESVGSVSGFTRQTIFESLEELEKNKKIVVAQHNLIGSIYKRSIWPFLKPIFSDFLDLKSNGTPDRDIYVKLNEKYNLHMPHTAYDKIIDHVLAKNKILRIATFNRYLFHLGLFGTSCVKSSKMDFINKEALRNFIRFNWNKLTTNSDFINDFVFDKNHCSFIEQCSKEPSEWDFGIWDKMINYDDIRKHTISSEREEYFKPSSEFFQYIGDKNLCLDVLDFGCGVGRNTFELSTYGRWNVLGYDNSQILKFSEVFCDHYYHKTIKDFPAVQFSNDWDVIREKKFDSIFCFLTLQHVPLPNLVKYLQDFKKMTKRLVVMGRRSHDGSQLSVWRILENNGWFPTSHVWKDNLPYTPDGNPEDHMICIYDN